MIQKIEISFPVPIELPELFETQLVELIDKVCKKYVSEHPGRVMWPAGVGNKVLWRELQEPDFDDSVLAIDVAEREDYKYGKI